MFDLHLPKETDVPLGLKITDDPVRRYRALIFLNGWMMGIYANELGPQHTSRCRLESSIQTGRTRSLLLS